MFFPGKESFRGFFAPVARADQIGRAVCAIFPREFGMKRDPASVGFSGPPARTAFALWTDGKMSGPIKSEGTQVIAALGLCAMNGFFHRTDKLDAVCLSIFERNLASDIRSVHKLPIGQELPLPQCILTAWHVRSVWRVRGHGLDLRN
jgi:hypothetical protein